MFHHRRDDLAAVGMVDPLGSWSTLDLQAQLAARHLRAVWEGSAGTLARPTRPPALPAGGPDRDWLFKDHRYGSALRRLLR